MLLIAGCTKTPALIVAEPGHNHWLTPGNRLVVLEEIDNYPECDVRTTDSISRLWWILDSIGSENTIVIRKDFSYTYDTLDALDMRLLKKEDLRAYRKLKNSYYSTFREGYDHYKVYRQPDSSVYKVVQIDSLEGIVVPCIYTECNSKSERFHISFWKTPALDKAYIFNRRLCKEMGVVWSY
jgi:hypothetical protein